MPVIARRRHRTSGFTLVEVMTAIVVIGIGMLAVGQLQSKALVSLQQSSARSQAAMLASAMADRIRSNPRGRDEYHLILPTKASSDCYSDTCAPKELAKFDAARWHQMVKNRLPGGDAVICRDGKDGAADDGTSAKPRCGKAGDDSPYAIKIWWDNKTKAESASGSAESATAKTERYVLTFRSKWSD